MSNEHEIRRIIREELEMRDTRFQFPRVYDYIPGKSELGIFPRPPLETLNDQEIEKLYQLYDESFGKISSFVYSVTDNPEGFDTIVDSLDLEVRTYDIVCRAGLRTVGKILSTSVDEFFAIRGLGRKRLNGIEVSLYRKGFVPVYNPQNE